MPLVTPNTVAAAAALAPLKDDEGGAAHPSAVKAAGPEVVTRALGELRARLGALAFALAHSGETAPAPAITARSGGDLFTAVEAWEGEAAETPRGRLYESLSVAASLLAFVVALPTLNLRGMRVDGGFIASTGFAESKESLLSQSDIAALQASLRAQVDTVLGDLLTEGSALGLLDLYAAVALSRPRPFAYPVVRSLR